MAWKMMLASAATMAVRSLPLAIMVPPSRPLVAAPIAGADMKPAPIEPSWILSGTPEARMAEHSRSADRTAMTAIWDCTAGSFRWYFGDDETVVILEGEVHILAPDGTERTLRVGDIAYFSAKTWATWTVDSYVKKIAFARKPFPAPLAMALRLRRMLRPKPAGAFS